MKKKTSKKPINTLANKITLFRILLIPPIIIALVEKQNMWVIGLLTFSMITDFLDGMVARKFGQRTKLGAFLDPLADKLLLTSVFMTLTLMNLIGTWVFVVIFSRDLLIVLGWIVIYILTGSSNIEPRLLGKVTTATQMLTALSCIIIVPEMVHQPLLWGAILLTIASTIDYIIVGEKRLGEWS